MDLQSQTVRMFKISDLKESPYQQALMGDVPAHALDVLIAGMKKKGQRDPIKILPNGEILDGHQRVRAAKKLGWEEIAVIVVDDLEPGEDTVKVFVIEANLVRRQMDPLAQARAFRQLKEIEKKKPVNKMGQSDREDLRDRIAKSLGEKSGRVLQRVERILDMPRPIQDAFSAKEINQKEALAFASLRKGQRQAAEQEILDGCPVKDVLRKYIPKAPAKKRPPSNEETDEMLDVMDAAACGVAKSYLPLHRKKTIFERTKRYMDALFIRELNARDAETKANLDEKISQMHALKLGGASDDIPSNEPCQPLSEPSPHLPDGGRTSERFAVAP